MSLVERGLDGKFLPTAICGTAAKYRGHGCRCGLCREAARLDQKKWRANNKETWQRMHRKDRLRRNYNLTPEQYDQMVVRQDGKCAICIKSQLKGILLVDHDHTTGVVRGLLCRSCNTKLGWYEKRNQSVADYIKRGLQ